jgi:hypothetical protein
MNEEMLEVLKEERVDEKPSRSVYKPKWLGNVTRMNSDRMRKIKLKYGRTKGRRRLGRPLKRPKHVYQGLTGDGWL